jgi:CRISPR-associated exonuclease Cas4
MTSDPIRISDFGLYISCPRLVYFDALGTLPRKSNPFHLLLRELMLRISSSQDLEGELLESLENLKRDLPVIYGDEIDLQELQIAAQQIEEIIPKIAHSLSASLDMILPCDLEVDMRSERLGLSGRLDRLVTEGKVPSIIRTGLAPEDGVWKRDRLQLTGYCVLAEEKYGCRITRGLVEYPRSGVIRSIQIRNVDRGRLFRIKERILQIKEGKLPDRPKDASCDDCAAADRCVARVSLASKFF